METTLIDKFLLLLTFNGEMKKPRGSVLEYAVAGAVLMELEKQGFIDSDTENIIPLRSDLPEDEILAQAHREVVSKGSMRIRDCLRWMAVRAPGLHKAALARLIEKGFLVKRQRRKMLVFQEEYVEATNHAGHDLKVHIFDTLKSNDTPLPDDIRLICLADATGLLREMFDNEERRKTQDRVEAVRRLDLVGQVTAVAIEDADLSITIEIQEP